MRQSDIDALASAVEELHGAPAVFVRTEPVEERSGDTMVWKGTVSVFRLDGHASATLCYAWAAPSDATHRERFYAVLHAAPVDSPAMAVRASLLAEAREKKS